MQEIKCPKCGEVFQVDETGYAQILNQVRDKEFNKELERRVEELHSKHKASEEITKLEQEKTLNEKLSEQKASLDKEINKQRLELDSNARRIAELEAQIKSFGTEKKLAVNEAVQAKNEELSKKESAIVELKGKLSSKDTEFELKEKSLKEQHAIEIKIKDEQIEQYKDFKARQSTKMVGESLEQHCYNEFNNIRMTAFPGAYFDKDNDASSGSKGDFIFRDFSDGTEFISIMFEMKNQTDTDTKKHKNEDFFKELDKDRREKGCEYAVLVSLLEPDNDLYNNGIVDVSYKYEKMYVVRPQFFIPIISLLRNAALNSVQFKHEIELMRNQQLDYSNFEDNMNEFKEKFGKNYETASKKFNDAINEIDKTITHLQKVKEALQSSENQLRLANDKAQDLSIKKLTKNAPSIREKLEAARGE